MKEPHPANGGAFTRMREIAQTTYTRRGTTFDSSVTGRFEAWTHGPFFGCFIGGNRDSTCVEFQTY